MDTYLNKIHVKLSTLDAEYPHLMSDDLTSEIHTLITLLEKENRQLYADHIEMLSLAEDLSYQM